MDEWVCDWLPVKQLIKYDRLVMTHKIQYGKCRDNLQDKSTQASIGIYKEQFPIYRRLNVEQDQRTA